MAKKQISIETITTRMNRILDAYQVIDENENQAGSASCTSNKINSNTYSTKNGLESHKNIINYAAYVSERVHESIKEENPISFRTRSSCRTKKSNCADTSATCTKRKMTNRKILTHVPNVGIENGVGGKKKNIKS